MRSPFSNAPLLSLVAAILIVAACSSLPLQRAARSPGRTEPFTASEQIAGEIMAYLMEVVLGRAGDPGTRAAWATRGRNLPLDFEMVRKRMFGPVPLRAELMVLDTNILGLSEVLYHYDPRLNLFKGTRDHDSLYPCAELMALRLFLVHKLIRYLPPPAPDLLRCGRYPVPADRRGDRSHRRCRLAGPDRRGAGSAFLKPAATWQGHQTDPKGKPKTVDNRAIESQRPATKNQALSGT